MNLRKTLTVTGATLTAVLLLAGCTNGTGASSSSSPSSSGGTATSTPSPSSSGFRPSRALPDNWPATIHPISGLELVGTFDKLAPATGATFTATWQSEGNQLDVLKAHIDAEEKTGYKVVGKFLSKPGEKTPTASYTLVKDDWTVAYTATVNDDMTVVNQMLIPMEAPAAKPSKKPAKPGKSGAKASATPRPSAS